MKKNEGMLNRQRKRTTGTKHGCKAYRVTQSSHRSLKYSRGDFKAPIPLENMHSLEGPCPKDQDDENHIDNFLQDLIHFIAGGSGES